MLSKEHHADVLEPIDEEQQPWNQKVIATCAEYFVQVLETTYANSTLQFDLLHHTRREI